MPDALGTALAQGCLVTLHAPSASGSEPPDADLSLVRAELISNLRDVELMSQVHRAVEACTRTSRGSLIARELVGDVVGDIYRGALSSDPRVPFPKRILAEVRRRIHRTAEKQKHHLSIDALGEKDAPVAPDPVARDRDDERSAAELRSRVARARERIGDDPPTLQLLTLYELGVTRKRDALRLGMTRLPGCAASAGRAVRVAGHRGDGQRSGNCCGPIGGTRPACDAACRGRSHRAGVGEQPYRARRKGCASSSYRRSSPAIAVHSTRATTRGGAATAAVPRPVQGACLHMEHDRLRPEDHHRDTHEAVQRPRTGGTSATALSATLMLSYLDNLY